jgi:phenylalanyl-tRNA synthetase beta chain
MKDHADLPTVNRRFIVRSGADRESPDSSPCNPLISRVCTTCTRSAQAFNRSGVHVNLKFFHGPLAQLSTLNAQLRFLPPQTHSVYKKTHSKAAAHSTSSFIPTPPLRFVFIRVHSWFPYVRALFYFDSHPDLAHFRAILSGKMKVTLNWLKDYVDFDWSPEQLAERLTMLGIEVEGVERQTGEFEGVVVAQILASDKHPNADKLSVCRVADGKGERQIVCGAKNYKVGDKVPLALPGCTLPTAPGQPPFTIKVGKLRGVESQGMMCSAKELGLAEDAEGLLILPADAQIGQALAQHLGRAGGDVIYDLEITPNRPDLNSIIGIAREISALTGNPLRLPKIEEKPVSTETASLVRVDLREPELCPRYVARIVRGVKIGPSPAWLKNRLEQVGIRSISNVVDVTNFVMLEVGQPLHAFDYHLLEKGADGIRTVVIRRAAPDEKFNTLDGQQRSLSSEMLLIADQNKGIALAGVMGGQNTEINTQTQDVLIESANFKPQNIRATSKKLDLRTDSSYRFERGADVGICEWASQRAAVLIQQLAGGEILSKPVDAYPNPQPKKSIKLRTRKVPELLGIDIPVAEQTRYLNSLELKVQSSGNDELIAEIPTFRVDMKREVDLIEEIVRLYGIDRVPSTPPRGAIGAHPFDSVYDSYSEVRRILTSCGLTEAQGQTLISDTALGQLAGEGIVQRTLRLENPLSSDMNVLRSTLIPGLLDSLRHNAHRQVNDVRLFEIGRVFGNLASANAAANTAAFSEERRLGIAITGARQNTFWSGSERDAELDIYDLKGIVEELFEQLGIRGVQWQRNESAGPLFLESATVSLGKHRAGEIGQLNPLTARKYDLRSAVLLAEFNLDFLLSRRNLAKSFEPLAAFPSVRRDVAMLVEESITHDRVLNVVKQTKPQNLESVSLFDVFRGKNVPPGRKSVAYAFTYRNKERTLTETEVNAAHEKVVERLKSELQAEIR